MFYDNLKSACKAKGTTITAVLKKFGVSTSNGTSWQKGTIPKTDIVIRFAEFLDVSTDYLLLGKTDSKSDELSSAEKQLLEHFRKLPESEQWKLVGRAEMLAEQAAAIQKADVS